MKSLPGFADVGYCNLPVRDVYFVVVNEAYYENLYAARHIITSNGLENKITDFFSKLRYNWQ